MSISLGTLMLSIESLSVDAMREMAAHLLERANSKESRLVMMEVIRDQRHNPVTSQEPGANVRVATGTTVTAGRSVDAWRPPGQALVDAAFPTTHETAAIKRRSM
jgi:hypothetical protein